ncbi:MAG: hypothetical protein HQM07_06500 [Zetaproteobacteria bacterium]|nr:hypothetical protein [Zetaproteobacteria bacterium]
MSEDKALWPAVEDGRVVEVLTRQVSGSLQDLHCSVEDALDRLSIIMETHSDDEFVSNVTKAVEDLQHIDRVMQRLDNVRKILDAWASEAVMPEGKDSGWAGYMTGKFVMPQEHLVLREVMQGVNLKGRGEGDNHG